MKKYINNYKNLCFILFVGLIIVSTLAITIGSVSLNSLVVWKIMINKIFNSNIFVVNWEENLEIIVWNLRAPRIATAILAGASLSFVGILMQVLTKNPLASPYILGISSGASTGAVLVILIFNATYFFVSIGAFIFGIFTSFLVFYFSNTNGFSSTRLVLIGTAISAIFSGITSLIIFVTPNERQIKDALFWMTGSLAGSTWEYVPLLVISLIIAFLLLYFKYEDLNILVTGDESALSLGLDLKKIRILIIVVSTFLTGIVVANVGIIGFVGLVIPHISRGLVGGNHKRLIPVAALLGANFLVFTDILTRAIFSSQEIPIGVITSLFGAPFFLSMLREKSYRFGGE